MSLIVIAGFQPSSSFRIERQTVPEGYTFGWKSGGTKRHFGGLVGYSVTLLGTAKIVCTPCKLAVGKRDFKLKESSLP